MSRDVKNATLKTQAVTEMDNHGNVIAAVEGTMK